MHRSLHELQKGDRFHFTSARHEQIDLPTGCQQVMACWGVRTPEGKAIDPWMLACRSGDGTVYNFALPPTIDVECVTE
jgi:hypothetical protein